mmetsp:Transcript_32409/g.63370  ORF Transcript_32409/g.63370 Transcript_32409/m.63370 type:complete len:307 (+) Transcript_32409:330-1250(+)
MFAERSRLFGQNGHTFFGVGHPCVAQRLERLPGVHAYTCSGFTYSHTSESWLSRQGNGASAGQRARRKRKRARWLDLQLLPASEEGCVRCQPFSTYKSSHRQSALSAQHDIDSEFESESEHSSDEDPALRHCPRPKPKRAAPRRVKDERELPIQQQYHFMKADRPRARVGWSRIHAWGLFAAHDYPQNTVLIEYLGEVIRKDVADRREKRYEDSGIPSCYMFRINDECIVDSTLKGNNSRMINHSCDPLCYTRVISVDGEEKILVIASRDVKKGDELTYNYFFAAEDEEDTLVCNCGADRCSGRLN